MTLAFTAKLANEDILCTCSPSSWLDVDNIVEFVYKKSRAKNAPPGGTVVFIDTPPTLFLTVAIKKLVAAGYNVHLRDHHDIEDGPSAGRTHELRAGAARLRETLGSKAVISSRKRNPACASLIAPGEFKDAVAIIVDADFDGWLGAMKALGVTYPELDEDSVILDGPWTSQLSGSEMSRLLVKAFYALPSFGFDASAFKRDFAELLSQFTLATQGDTSAQLFLHSRVMAWEKAAKRATELAKTATEVAPGAWLVEATNEPRFDLGRLMSILENNPSCRVTIIHRDEGMVAEYFGLQYTIILAPSEKNALNLHSLLPLGSEACSPQEGVFSNTSFLLELSEAKYQSFLPELRSYLAKAPMVFPQVRAQAPTNFYSH
jgi:hypothetical protein